MGHSIANQPGQGTTRRAFLKQAFALTGVSAGAALLNACGSSNATATAAPPAAQQPTTLPSPAPTTAATAGTVPTPAAGAAPTSEATAGATAPTASSTSQDATPTIVAAANAFLATLSDSEKESVLFDWTDTAQKQRWSNFPDGAFDRAGLMWGNMSEATRSAWQQVMQTILSAEGYNRVVAEWNADDTLAGGGGGGRRSARTTTTPPSSARRRKPTPGSGNGAGTTSRSTPRLPAPTSGSRRASLAWSRSNIPIPNTVRPLGDIEDEAFALVNSLDATQQQTAILGDTAIDLVLGPGQDGKTIQSEGLPASQMTADQQAALLKLVGHYTGLANDEDAVVRNAEIQSTLNETYLAW